jgi:hypothetical protein
MRAVAELRHEFGSNSAGAITKRCRVHQTLSSATASPQQQRSRFMNNPPHVRALSQSRARPRMILVPQLSFQVVQNTPEEPGPRYFPGFENSARRACFISSRPEQARRTPHAPYPRTRKFSSSHMFHSKSGKHPRRTPHAPLRRIRKLRSSRMFHFKSSGTRTKNPGRATSQISNFLLTPLFTPQADFGHDTDVHT